MDVPYADAPPATRTVAGDSRPHAAVCERARSTDSTAGTDVDRVARRGVSLGSPLVVEAAQIASYRDISNRELLADGLSVETVLKREGISCTHLAGHLNRDLPACRKHQQARNLLQVAVTSGANGTCRLVGEDRGR